jgi:hypothetical protein
MKYQLVLQFQVESVQEFDELVVLEMTKTWLTKTW